jgi:S-formylglutathione hydrolase FrmB
MSIKACLLAALLAAAPAFAQVTTEAPPAVPGAKPVSIEHIKVHSPSIEGNLEGDSPDRDVFVVLPPGYASHPDKRYPVVYALHGYWIGAEQWMKEIHVPQTVEGAFAKGAAEMILVFPDSKTLYDGSFYSSSVTVGDFETFIAHDLVSYIDGHYRTLAARESRGLAGHSMGGYGAVRIGIKHADMFGALYILSPCCLSARTVEPGDIPALEGVKVPGDMAKLSFLAHGHVTAAAAWSPDPKNPPLYFDLPVKDGAVQPDILAKWAANAPLAFLDQYIPSVRQYRAIAMDVGDQDGLKIDAGKLHEAFDLYGIKNSFEIYPGTHTSHVAYRIQEQVIPFFAKNLRF